MTVRVNQQRVIKAKPSDDETPEDWHWKSSRTISLKPGQAVPVRVRFEYAYRDPDWNAVVGAPILFWEGPGIPRQVVPPSAFTTAEGGEGLLASYRWQFEGTTYEDSGIQPNVEDVWFGSPILGFENRGLRVAIAEELMSRQLSADALAACDPRAPENHPLCGDGEKRRCAFQCLEAMGCSGRSDCIRAMCERSDHWRAASRLWHVMYLYRVARAGVEDEALDILLTWAQQNRDFFFFWLGDGCIDLNRLMHHRRATRGIAVNLLNAQLGTGLERLESEGLEDEGGYCNLPIASICAYGHQARGEIDSWIDKLDDRLADDQLIGDRRVNWLIARAMAEEVRGSRIPLGRHWHAGEDLQASFGWLDEAMLVVESADVERRIVRERGARLLALKDWQGARAAVAKYPELAGWRRLIKEGRAEYRKLVKKEKREMDDILLAELRRRADDAADSGNEVDAKRYRKQVESLERVDSASR